MITKDLRERSRDKWNHAANSPSGEEVALGCQLRIADAIEALVPAVAKAATRIDELQREIVDLRKRYVQEMLRGQRVDGLLATERRRAAALAGHLKRAKAAPNVVVVYRGPFPEVRLDRPHSGRFFERGKPALIYVQDGQELPESFEILIDNRKPKASRARKAVKP
jgi:hypothetical protein